MHPATRGRRLLVLFSWMALVVYWSGQSNLPIDQPFFADLVLGLQHRLAHFVAFGLMGLLARWAFGSLPRVAWLAIVATSIFGATDEWHQSFTAGRHPRIDDWAFDTASAAIAVYVWSRLPAEPWPVWARALAPVGVAAAFAVGIALAVWTSVVGTPAS